MGRYLKYLEIVNKIDAAVEKKVSGRVDIDKDLPKIKTMLEVQKLALEMSMCIDRIDDNVKSSFKLYAKGDPSARGVVEEVLEKMKESGGMGQPGSGGESASGRDFRRGRENPESDRGYSTRSWFAPGRSDARGEMNTHEEEDRRGRRPRSGMYGDTEENYGMGTQALFDHFNEEDRRGRSPRTGRFVHRASMEDDARNFFPLTYPGFPFGMSNGRDGMSEQLRMGFLGNGMGGNAPYNYAPMPHEQRNSDSLVSPLIKAPNSDQSNAANTSDATAANAANAAAGAK